MASSARLIGRNAIRALPLLPVIWLVAWSPAPQAQAHPQPELRSASSPGQAPLALSVSEPGFKPAAAPNTVPVTFTGMQAGSYPTHLHSRCSGSASFHITVLQTLVVGAGGEGTIQVPSSYFDRGLCVIVYSGSSLTKVVATRAV